MKYCPKTKGRSHKWVTDLTDTNYNQGIHCQVRLKNGVRMLEEATEKFQHPELCHITLQGGKDVSDYQQILRRFGRLLKEAGWAYMYRACIEYDREKELHCHIMLVIDHVSSKHPMAAIGWTGSESLIANAVNYFNDSRHIRFDVAKPRNSGCTAYRTKRVSKTVYENFDDCVEWLSYIYKARSKESNPDYRIYMSSR